MELSDSRSSDDVFSTPPERVHTHRSRIYFPESPSPTRRRPYSAEGSAMHVHANPPIRRGSPLNPQRAPAHDRRRLNSTDGLSPTSEPLFRSRRSPLLVPMDDSVPSNVRNIPEMDTGANGDHVFSDEYDLYPRILQDVQRALKVKAKREAKMKATRSGSDHDQPILASTSLSSKQTKSPGRGPYPRLASPPPFRKTSGSTSSDIDFSPSTRRPPAQTSQHPVPSSLDNGLTLDWGGSTIDDVKQDRKWSLSTRRRDKMPPLELMQDQQEKVHRERLSKLRASASSQTLRKAQLTSDQLQRRYSLFQVTQSGSASLNLAAASRWYGSHDDTTREELERVEPLTWLKHLPRRTKHLSRWHLSARIIEEFVTAQTTPHQAIFQPQPQAPRMEPIPEDQSLQNLPRTHEGSPERIFVSADGRLRSPRSSFDVESRRSAESALSSISSSPVVSPVPSTTPYGRPRTRTPSRQYAGSGGEDSLRTPATADTSPEQPSRRATLSPDLTNMRKKALTNMGDNLPKLVLPSSDVEESNTEQTEQDNKHSPSPSPANRSRSDLNPHIQNQRLASSPMLRHSPAPLPPPEDPQKEMENEEALRREYERKAALLRDSVQHNQRIRQLLNRISTGVKEYDSVQRNAMNILGKKHQALPKELVESFGHDPAAVTGATRRLRGWRAVEDIHERLVKQRQVFSAFLTLESHRTTDHGSILDDKVSSLIRSLSVLEEQKVQLATKAKEVENVLQGVQESYKEVKADYDKTVPMTSTLYPEISQAIALEESYKDQYQQIWEFGMDALTLLLDTVTPFWRTYGKTIGEDIRDFLIIPLYRNEFTGESKRYSINNLPKRSLRHWLGLVLFFIVSVFVTTFQARVALLSTMHFRLKWIPLEGVRYSALPMFWIGILMQWGAVIVECGIVLLEMGAIVWWMGWTVNLLR